MRVAADALCGCRCGCSVFPQLEATGFARSTLQLAWDFTTASVNNTIGRALFMRDDALARVTAEPPAVVIDAVDRYDCSNPKQVVASFVWYAARVRCALCRVSLRLSPSLSASLHLPLFSHSLLV